MKNPLKKNEHELEQNMLYLLQRIADLKQRYSLMKRTKRAGMSSEQKYVLKKGLRKMKKKVSIARQDLHKLKTLHTIVQAKGRG